MTTEPRCPHAVILAGGRSSRMGHDKALIKLGQETLIERTCQIALTVAHEVSVISPWPERYHALLPDTIQLIQERPLAGHATLHQGPAVALAQAMNHLDTTEPVWMLTLACDLPNLLTVTLQDWIASLPASTDNSVVALPRRQQRWEPLCGFYKTSGYASLQAYLDTGRRSLQGWLATQSVIQLPLADPHLLTNLNTPDDLTHWRQQFSL